MHLTAIQSPMRPPRLAALASSFSWGVIGGSVGLNALIKSNQENSHIQSTVPAGVTVHIDVNDIYYSGIVLTTACALIALLSLIFLIQHLYVSFTPSTLHARQSNAASPSSFGGDTYPSARSLLVQSLLLGGCWLWLLATQIPFTLFFATRSANITAFLEGFELPQDMVQAFQDALGMTSVYRKIDYLRLVAILPWLTILFTLIASGVLLVAALRTYDAQFEIHAQSYQARNASATKVDTEKVVAGDQA